MSRVAIVGYGNVGFHLARHISSNRHEVSIFSRTSSEKYVHRLDKLDPDQYDFVILSVPDDRIKEISDGLVSSEAVVLHTSGANAISDLSKHKKHGVIYPLQTFSRTKKVDFRTVPFFVEGSDAGEKAIFTFVRTFSNEVRLLTSSNRSKLHLAAVFACNFSNHMYHLAECLLEEMDMKFQDLKPLVIETLKKAIAINPSQSQTGPAIRNDQETIEKHLALLKDERLQNIYKQVTQNIIDLA